MTQAWPHLRELVEVAGALQGTAPVGGADGHVVLAPAAGSETSGARVRAWGRVIVGWDSGCQQLDEHVRGMQQVAGSSNRHNDAKVELFRGQQA